MGEFRHFTRAELAGAAGVDPWQIDQSLIFFDTGDDTWNAVVHGLDPSQEKALGWQVNEQFLRSQMESQVGRIDYLLDRAKYSSLEDMALDRPDSFSAMEVEYLTDSAAAFGYERVGDSWVYVRK